MGRVILEETVFEIWKMRSGHIGESRREESGQILGWSSIMQKGLEVRKNEVQCLKGRNSLKGKVKGRTGLQR